MEIRTSTVAVVAASCITVGAAGAFLMNRPSGAPQPALAADVATGGVEQSEAVVSDAPVETAPVQAAPVTPSVAAPATRRTDPTPAQKAGQTRPATVAPAPRPFPG